MTPRLPGWAHRRPPPRWRYIVQEHEEQRHLFTYALAAVATMACAVVVVLTLYAAHLEHAAPRTGKMWTSRR